MMQRPPFVLRHLVVIVIVAASIALGVLGFYRWEQSHAPSELRAASEGKIQPDGLWASLRAQTGKAQSSSIIHLQWDPSSKPIRRSSYAILYIYDGGIPNTRVLDRRTLDFGSTDYKPASDEVTFHLMLPGGRSGGEFLLVLLGSRFMLKPDADAALKPRGLNPAK